MLVSILKLKCLINVYHFQESLVTYSTVSNFTSCSAHARTHFLQWGALIGRTDLACRWNSPQVIYAVLGAVGNRPIQ